MNPRELRLDNWVQHTPEHGALNNWQITSIGHGVVDLIRQGSTRVHNRYGVFYNDISPIALTEEYIAGCGFENVVKFQYELNNIQIKLVDGVCAVRVGYINRVCKIKHVHQLQNLYHDLTDGDFNLTEEKQ